MTKVLITSLFLCLSARKMVMTGFLAGVPSGASSGTSQLPDRVPLDRISLEARDQIHLHAIDRLWSISKRPINKRDGYFCANEMINAPPRGWRTPRIMWRGASPGFANAFQDNVWVRMATMAPCTAWDLLHGVKAVARLTFPWLIAR
ncbi:hypothetical protein F5Y14DRAFT_454189 [Nemania sp. NC0429]|nr:hypothetical protein F5Y14DRAFT_454189 [Nemania sp. NC0429]